MAGLRRCALTPRISSAVEDIEIGLPLLLAFLPFGVLPVLAE